MINAMSDYDAELMLRAGKGDADAYRELFERNYRRAVNVAYRSTASIDQAEDIAMEAFARIYEARASYKPAARFSTYLFRVLTNLCLNAARKGACIAQEPIGDRDIPDAGSDPAEEVSRAQVGRAVREAVVALPANQRMAVVLTRYEGLSYEETAKAMGISVGAVESLLHRAKANLRKTLRGFL